MSYLRYAIKLFIRRVSSLYFQDFPITSLDCCSKERYALELLSSISNLLDDSCKKFNFFELFQKIGLFKISNELGLTIKN